MTIEPVLNNEWRITYEETITFKYFFRCESSNCEKLHTETYLRDNARCFDVSTIDNYYSDKDSYFHIVGLTSMFAKRSKPATVIYEVECEILSNSFQLGTYDVR